MKKNNMIKRRLTMVKEAIYVVVGLFLTIFLSGQLGNGDFFNIKTAFGYGGGAGGGTSAPTAISTIGTANLSIPMSISAAQTGNLSQPLSDGSKVDLVVPKGAVSALTTFSVTGGSLTSSLNPIQTTGATILNNQVYNINATSNNTVVKSFSSNLSITITVPNLPASTANLGVYYFNDTSSEWVLIPGASFDVTASKATFSINHLTQFAVFNIAGLPATVKVAQKTEETVTPVTPSTSNLDNADFIVLEKSLVKKVSKALTSRLSGRILLQVEAQGQAWYVYPTNGAKYFLNRPADAFAIMRKLGLGVSNKTFATFSSGKAPARLAGRILLKVEEHGEAYYVNPVDLKMYYLGRPADAFAIMRQLGLGITNANLRQITVEEVK